MFPIPWNKLFRKKDGSITTLDDAISSGGGEPYTLPTASAEVKGGIKIGSGLAMEGEVLSTTGGGSKYLHAIHWSGTYNITTIIINGSSTALTNSDIAAFLNEYSFGTGEALYMASGKATSDSYIVGLGVAGTTIKYLDSSGTWAGVGVSCTDTVVSI